jgi:hypothetical protein
MVSERFVLDASVTAAWCFRNEGSALTMALLEQMRQRKAVVPTLWHVETANMLLQAEPSPAQGVCYEAESRERYGVAQIGCSDLIFFASVGSPPGIQAARISSDGSVAPWHLLRDYAQGVVMPVGALPVRGGAAPTGAKGDPITLAALAITVAPAAVQGLITMLQAWLTRHERATVTVESEGETLTVTGTPSADQQKVISAFLRRHKR